jgi:CBS domain-containing protein
MRVGDICTREVVCASSETTVAAAARTMRQFHIGDVVVTRLENGRRIPLGIVTDRDIVIGVVATDLAPNALTIGDIMGTELATAQESEDVFDAVQRMRNKGVRRMPIVDAGNNLVGIVSIDDIIEILAEELHQLAHLISREQMHERDARR